MRAMGAGSLMEREDAGHPCFHLIEKLEENQGTALRLTMALARWLIDYDCIALERARRLRSSNEDKLDL